MAGVPAFGTLTPNVCHVADPACLQLCPPGSALPSAEAASTTAGRAGGCDLLAAWLADNPTLAPDAAKPVDLLRFRSWQDMPLPLRADCQAVLTHPAVLRQAEMRPKAHIDGKQCAPWPLPRRRLAAPAASIAHTPSR